MFIRALVVVTLPLLAQQAEGPSTQLQRRAAPPARILQFEAQPTTIKAGESVTLLWSVENPQGTSIDQGIGVVTPRGSRRITPASTTTYTLSTKGFNGEVSKQITVTVTGAAAKAAAPAASGKKEVPRTPDGKPDMTGVYGYVAARNISAPPLKPGGDKAKIVRPENFAGLTSDCMPLGVPGSINVPYPFQIIQTPATFVIFYEYPNTFRIIPTDGRPHPVDPDPTWMGNSIAHWDGDTLVIDTVAMNTKTEVFGYRHGDDLHVIEKFRRVDYDTLQYDVTIEDPSFLASPWVMPTRTFPLRPELEKIDEFVCENNRDYSRFFKKD